MPLPAPELTGELERMFTGGSDEFACRERYRLGVKDAAGHVDERDDEDQFERVEEMIGQL